jgi:hypothetical protein
LSAAVTLKAPTDAGVKSPVPSIAPPEADHAGANATGFPLASSPNAANRCESSAVMAADAGSTRILASAPGMTVTVARPETMPVFASTVIVPVLSGVKRPDWSIAPPVALHLTCADTGWPFLSYACAANICVWSAVIVACEGFTSMRAIAPQFVTGALENQTSVSRFRSSLHT